MKTKYAHINIIAKDWKLLCEFYQEIFECVPISTERDHHGESVDLLTGISKVRVKGRHLRVPGYGENAPTIEIFSLRKSISARSPSNLQILCTSIAWLSASRVIVATTT